MHIIERKILRYQVHDALVYWIFIPILVTGSGKLVDYTLQLPPIQLSGIGKAITFVLLGSGLVIIWRAMHDFYHYGKGTPNPRHPPKVLVSQGVYSMCRHPMFFGYDLAALGIVLMSCSFGMLILSYPVFVAVQIWFLQKEELYLARRFRGEFEEYKNRVPFLIPLLHIRSS